MYLHTEQSYRGWTLDVYLADDLWNCDYWEPGTTGVEWSTQHRTRRGAIDAAKDHIDSLETPKGTP